VVVVVVVEPGLTGVSTGVSSGPSPTTGNSSSGTTLEPAGLFGKLPGLEDPVEEVVVVVVLD
jgi:hypothetical protein